MAGNEVTVAMVYLEEGDGEGGIAHPTQDLVASLADHVDVREIPIENGRSANPFYWYNLGRQAATEADVVHIQFEYGSFGQLRGMFLGSFFPVFARAIDVPMVTTLHNFRDRRIDWSVTNPRSMVQHLAEHATWFVDRSLVRHTDHFVPLMKAEESLLQRHGVPLERIDHIPLVAESDPEFWDEETAKDELGLVGRRVVTAFGWVRNSKGYHRVIDILPGLPDDTVFLVAGGTRTEEQTAYFEGLKAMVADRGLEDQVKFLGYVGRDQHPVVMSASDVVVLPYLDNRASDALARALSYHVPVVASSNEEFSAIEAKWDCIITASNDEELLTAIETALTDEEERQRLIERAEQFTSQMNWASVAKRIVKIYSAVGR